MAILLTNDDGIDAPGLAAMAQALAGLDDLYVSAPADNKSGVGMGITLGRSLKAAAHPDGKFGETRHSLDGTPADAAKYGLQHLLAGKRPRLVASGINYGPNLGVNVRCSGTVGAAFEAVVAGIPALAVSVDFVENVDWDGAMYYARKLAEKMLSLPEDTEPFVLNVNVPSRQRGDIPGLVVTHHGMGGIRDSLRADPDGEYRLAAEWIELGPDADCDMAAFNAGYAVATPLRFEMTHNAILADLCEAWKDDILTMNKR